MRTKKFVISISICVMVALTAILLVGCTKPAYDEFTLNGWEYIALQRMGKSANEVDITKLKVSDFINLDQSSNEDHIYTDGDKNENEEGWYVSLIDNFNVNDSEEYKNNSGLNPDIWATSRHDVRHKSQNKLHPEYANYWCSEMVSVVDGKVVVKASYLDSHNCSVCNANGYKKGRFTGGFETRAEVKNSKGEYDSNIKWGQAFGYFEASVKFPDVDGMWSAFWLQGNEMREIGYEGLDGTEIDIYESAFRKDNKKYSRMGHALLWNGYGESAKVSGAIRNLGKNNLYDGKYHKFALLWTPECYIFFIDDIATWATNAGGVCRVPEFLRFTNEIDAGDGWGPHGQKIGQFAHDKQSNFYVDYVRVYQNVNYEKFIAPSIDGKQYSKANNFESAYKSDYDKAN